MKVIFNISVILIATIILFSSVYIGYFSDVEEKEISDNQNNTNNETGDESNNHNNGNDNEDNDNEDNNGDLDFTHRVFIEEGTSTTCTFCPEVAEILEELFDPDDPDFYHVSLVDDESDKANSRLNENYNVLGFPVVFIDGGYRIIMGAKEKSLFVNQISEAKNRDVPKLHLNLNSTWKQDKTELTCTVTIINKESSTYNGRLRVYISEIVSRWIDYNGDAYHYAFIDYAINEDIEIKADEKKVISEVWDADSVGFSDVLPENLYVVAVIFNSTSTKKYADPPFNTKEFDSYYADAAHGTRVQEGGLPPTIGIVKPKKNIRYLKGNEFGKTYILKKPIIFGPITIISNPQSEAEIERVDFVFKGPFGETTESITSAPYEFTWDTFAVGRYTITVTLYDSEGKSASDDREVFALIIPEDMIPS